jgi:ribosomal protein L11 methyltransferase
MNQETQRWSFVLDWKAQWADHGLNFHDGYVHIDLPEAIVPEWNQLKLIPGAGFGDLSHPTTHLVLRMMQGHVASQPILDLGCGSGVLGLCAVALGAKHVYAIDIDVEALDHSKENAVLNGMENKFSFYLPQKFQLSQPVSDPVILVNMIFTEQRNAWKALEAITGRICIASGILAEHQHDYLQWMNTQGWQLSDRQEENGWLGFLFTKE